MNRASANQWRTNVRGGFVSRINARKRRLISRRRREIWKRRKSGKSGRIMAPTVWSKRFISLDFHTRISFNCPQRIVPIENLSRIA